MKPCRLNNIIIASWEVEVPFDCLSEFSESIASITAMVDDLRRHIDMYQSADYLGRARESVLRVLWILSARGLFDPQHPLPLREIYSVYAMHHGSLLTGKAYPLSVVMSAFEPSSQMEAFRVSDLPDFVPDSPDKVK